MKDLSFYLPSVVLHNNICAGLPDRDTGLSPVYRCSSKIGVQVHQYLPWHWTVVIFRNRSVANLIPTLHLPQMYVYQQTFLLLPPCPYRLPEATTKQSVSIFYCMFRNQQHRCFPSFGTVPLAGPSRAGSGPRRKSPPPRQRKDRLKIFTLNGKTCHDKWVPFTTAVRVVGLWMGEWHSVWRIAADILNNVVADSRHGVVLQLRGWARCWQLAVTTGIVTKHEHLPRTWTDTSVRLKQWRRDMRFGTWNVRSLYRSGSLTAAARELDWSCSI